MLLNKIIFCNYVVENSIYIVVLIFFKLIKNMYIFVNFFKYIEWGSMNKNIIKMFLDSYIYYILSGFFFYKLKDWDLFIFFF